METSGRLPSIGTEISSKRRPSIGPLVRVPVYYPHGPNSMSPALIHHPITLWFTCPQPMEDLMSVEPPALS